MEQAADPRAGSHEGGPLTGPGSRVRLALALLHACSVDVCGGAIISLFAEESSLQYV
jgi:hypothetical protein